MLQALQQLGLSYYESKALDVVLKEKCTVKSLWKKAGIPPGKMYSVLKLLQEKKLVTVTDERPKKVFVENASEAISCLIEKAQKWQDHVLAELRSYATVFDAAQSQPSKFFEMGTTIEENKRIQLRSFTEAQKEVCQILNVHHKPNSNRSSKTVWEKAIENAIQRDVVFRCIYPVNCVIPTILAQLNRKYPNKFQVRRLDTDFTRCDVVDGKKVLIKLVHHDAVSYGGVIFVENERFAQNLQKIFDEFWESASQSL